MAVLLETSLGDIVIDLFTSHAPKTCLNFLKLCKVKYYNNSLFYDVQRDYITRCGHLDSDTSIFGYFLLSLISGDEHRYFEDEIHPHLRHDRKGIVSMASRAPDLNGSHVILYTVLHHSHI
jgi:peptidyl-prolyl cis-trans isomerase-like 4